MNMNDYQQKARATAIYSAFGGAGWVYPALGLAGEAGEIANKLKKVVRDDDGQVSEQTRRALKEELGDALWYISQLAHELGFKLDEVAEANVAKLASRVERGKITGSGDQR